MGITIHQIKSSHIKVAHSSTRSLDRIVRVALSIPFVVLITHHLIVESTPAYSALCSTSPAPTPPQLRPPLAPPVHAHTIPTAMLASLRSASLGD